MLFDEVLIFFDELNNQNGTKLLKARYESVRFGLQNFFNSGLEPVDKENWTLSKTERFDVYNTKRGRKYWKHQKNGVVEKISSNSQTLRDDIERMSPVDREGHGDLGLIIENENILVESMRREHPLSEATLEQLLFPIEQYLTKESHPPIEIYLSPRDKPLDEANTVASQKHVTDLNNFNRGLAEPVLQDKEKVEGNEFDMPKSPKEQIKGRKRKSRIDLSILIHEDLPDSIPQIENVNMNHTSPETDILKENLVDGESSMERPRQFEIENPQSHQRNDAISTPNTRRIRRPESATDATSSYRSLFGGPLDSSSSGSSPTTR